MLRSGGHPSAVDFGGDRALQQGYGYDDSVTSFEALQDSLKSPKSAVLDPDFLPDADIRPRLVAQTRIDQSANRLDFSVVHGNRILSDPHDGNEAGGLQYGQSVFWVESAEEVTGEQRKL